MKRILAFAALVLSLAGAQQEIQPGDMWAFSQRMFGETDTVVVPCEDIEAVARRAEASIGFGEAKLPDYEVMCGVTDVDAATFRQSWNLNMAYQDVLPMHAVTAWTLIDEGTYQRRWYERTLMGSLNVIVRDNRTVEMGWIVDPLF